jgi:hypothetical protein
MVSAVTEDVTLKPGITSKSSELGMALRLLLPAAVSPTPPARVTTKE